MCVCVCVSVCVGVRVRVCVAVPLYHDNCFISLSEWANMLMNVIVVSMVS